jgi:hypothetical protein
VSKRQAVHALIDELSDEKLEAARQALEDLRDAEFDLREADERELQRRELECDEGDRMGMREFLLELRAERISDSGP